MKLPTNRDIFFCSIGIALGVLALTAMTNLGAINYIKPRLQACQRSDIDANDFANATGYHYYDDRIGFGIMNTFVCVITQFFHDLATDGIAGTFIGFGIFVTALPALILMALEAGRPDAKGIIRYPIVIGLVTQVLGVSVALPLLWFPSYVLGRGIGPLSQRRIILSVIPAMAFLIFAILTFFLDATTSFWATCAGILAGPAIVLSFVPLWACGITPSAKSADLSTVPYAAMGAICFLLWLWLLLLLLIPTVGVNPMAVYNVLWAEASLCTKIMAVDLVVLWLTGIVIIAYQKVSAALEAVGLSCLFGPGAGIALVLAGLQVQDGKIVPSLLEGTRKESRASAKKDD